MCKSLVSLRRQWSGSSIGHECSFHQLAPYIGKLKTSIAHTLVAAYSASGSTVLEPFSGSGVVALEALLQGRHVIANDISPYAAVLTRAKLFAPKSESAAIQRAIDYSGEAKRRARRNRWRVNAPRWVKEFFHYKTLSEALTLAQILRRQEEWFLLACLLGILHHQRPGFLSYPSSHLVPYLRGKKFPRSEFPEMYEYRDIEPRLVAKVRRAFRRVSLSEHKTWCRFEKGDISCLRVRKKVDLLLTSPPYMNALDYGRDNRLRLWFLGVNSCRELDQRNCRKPEDFRALMRHLAELANGCLSRNGKAVLVIGEVRRKQQTINTAAVVKAAFLNEGNFRLADSVEDLVPDIRRTRKGCAATKREWIMVFSRK